MSVFRGNSPEKLMISTVIFLLFTLVLPIFPRSERLHLLSKRDHIHSGGRLDVAVTVHKVARLRTNENQKSRA